MMTATEQQPTGTLEGGVALVSYEARSICAAINRPLRPCITRRIRAVNGSLDT
jgi:hypothetical protein